MQTDGYTEKLLAGQLPSSDSVHYVTMHGKMFHAHESQMKSDRIRKQKTRRKRNRGETRSKAKRRKTKTSKWKLNLSTWLRPEYREPCQDLLKGDSSVGTAWRLKEWIFRKVLNFATITKFWFNCSLMTCPVGALSTDPGRAQEEQEEDLGGVGGLSISFYIIIIIIPRRRRRIR